MKTQEVVLDNLHNLAALCRDFIDIGEDEEVWRRHLLTVENAITLITNYQHLVEWLLETVDSWKEEEE